MFTHFSPLQHQEYWQSKGLLHSYLQEWSHCHLYPPCSHCFHNRFLYIVLVLIITALFAHEFRTCVPSIFLATYMLNDTRFTPYIMVRTFHFSNQFAFCLFHTLTPRLTSAFWIPAWTRTDAIFTAKNLTLSACLSTDNYTTYTGQYLPTASASIVQLARFAIMSYSLFLSIRIEDSMSFHIHCYELLNDSSVSDAQAQCKAHNLINVYCSRVLQLNIDILDAHIAAK